MAAIASMSLGYVTMKLTARIGGTRETVTVPQGERQFISTPVILGVLFLLANADHKSALLFPPAVKRLVSIT